MGTTPNDHELVAKLEAHDEDDRIRALAHLRERALWIDDQRVSGIPTSESPRTQEVDT